MSTTRLAALLLLMAAGGLACTSPEAGRARSGGSGADVGNVGAEVDMHGKLDPFHDTPKKGPTR